MNGYGMYFFASGNKFEGNFVDNQVNGFGVYIETNTQRYEGNWLENKLVEGEKEF